MSRTGLVPARPTPRDRDTSIHDTATTSTTPMLFGYLPCHFHACVSRQRHEGESRSILSVTVFTRGIITSYLLRQSPPDHKDNNKRSPAAGTAARWRRRSPTARGRDRARIIPSTRVAAEGESRSSDWEPDVDAGVPQRQRNSECGAAIALAFCSRASQPGHRRLNGRATATGF
jgi:hypothetical protein